MEHSPLLAPSARLAKAALQVHEGTTAFSAGITPLLEDQLMNGSLTRRLSKRQIEVLQLVGPGCCNSEIGRRLFISENTVRWHVKKLKEHFKVRSRTELVSYAVMAGLVAGGERLMVSGER